MSAEEKTAQDDDVIVDRYLRSQAFSDLYASVMDFVSDLARYLDGDGRQDMKSFDRRKAHHYAILTRRLTTDAVRVANVVLTLRSVRDGNLTFTRGMSDIKNIDIASLAHGTQHFVGLPPELLSQADQCAVLQGELSRLLESMKGEARSGANQVHVVIDLIDEALGKWGRSV